MVLERSVRRSQGAHGEQNHNKTVQGRDSLHIRGICFDEAPQCDRMTATGQDTDKNNIQYTK